MAPAASVPSSLSASPLSSLPSPSPPTLSSDPFLSHLHTRLTSAERCFLLSDFSTALSSSLDILHELVILTSSFTSPTPLLPPTHSCSSDCVCLPTFTLALQAASALSHPFPSLTALADQWYGGVERLPCDALQLLVMAGMGERRWGEVVKAMVGWLERRKKGAVVGGGGDRVSDAEYVRVMELLVFHALLPMGEFSEAAMLVRRSERLERERKDVWVATIRRMEEAMESTENRREAAATTSRSDREQLQSSREEKRRTEGPTQKQPQQQRQLAPSLLDDLHSEEDGQKLDSSLAPSAQLLPSSSPLSWLSSSLLSLHGRIFLALHAYSPQVATMYQRVIASLVRHHRAIALALLLVLLLRLRPLLVRLWQVPLNRLKQTAWWGWAASEADNLARLTLSTGFGRLLW